MAASIVETSTDEWTIDIDDTTQELVVLQGVLV